MTNLEVSIELLQQLYLKLLTPVSQYHLWRTELEYDLVTQELSYLCPCAFRNRLSDCLLGQIVCDHYDHLVALSCHPDLEDINTYPLKWTRHQRQRL